jgi:T-complex protein 1 subunit alpha
MVKELKSLFLLEVLSSVSNFVLGFDLGQKFAEYQQANLVQYIIIGLTLGYAINCTVASQAMKTKITGAKIACLDMNLQKTRMHLGVNIVIDDPNKLEDIRRRELEITTEIIKKILASGANVVFTTKGIDDMCLKLFVEAGAIAVRRCKKEDLKRIAKATGATLISSLANLEGEETFESSLLGYAEEVVQERISDDECILVKGTKVFSSASIILRGANDYMLEEMERSIHDCLCAVKRTLESNSVVPGGGCVEAALSIYLENYATSVVLFILTRHHVNN